MLLGSLVRPVLPVWFRLCLLAALAVVVVGNETQLVRIRLPQNGRQVPSTVIADGGRAGAWQFGFEMGTGLRTFMTSSLPHLAALTVALLASWPYALFAGVAFGAGRAVMPLVRIGWGDGADWDRRYRRAGRPFRLLVTITMLLAVSGVALQATS
ncbi:MAG TPA: hypothetical protein VFH03_19710 [Actinoplanes sp.]|nr:hypothetical protein [Actinoplanes sp.]